MQRREPGTAIRADRRRPDERFPRPLVENAILSVGIDRVLSGKRGRRIGYVFYEAFRPTELRAPQVAVGVGDCAQMFVADEKNAAAARKTNGVYFMRVWGWVGVEADDNSLTPQLSGRLFLKIAAEERTIGPVLANIRAVATISRKNRRTSAKPAG